MLMFASSVPKSGQCPRVERHELSICEFECDHDHDCAGDAKCCDTGCGKLCTLPGESGSLVTELFPHMFFLLPPHNGMFDVISS